MAIAGTRWYTDGGEDGNGGTAPPRAQGWVDSVIATSTLFVFCGAMHILGTLALLALWTQSAYIAGALAVVVGTVFLPARRWDELLRSHVARTWRTYFRFSFVSMEILDPTRKYVFAESPHGVMPLGPVLAGTAVHMIFPKMTVGAA